MTKRQFLYNMLQEICKNYPKQFHIKIDFTNHFIDRMVERYEGDFYRGALELTECLDKNTCLIVFYLNVDGILPERGLIEFNQYQVRGNVMNGVYVMSTFVKP